MKYFNIPIKGHIISVSVWCNIVKQLSNTKILQFLIFAKYF